MGSHTFIVLFELLHALAAQWLGRRHERIANGRHH